MFLDIKVTRLWEHVQWLDLHNYGGFHISQPEQETGGDANDGWYKDKTILSSDLMSNEMDWNIAEYLPPACRTVFLDTVGDYLNQVIQYDEAAGEEQDQARANQSTDPGDKFPARARFFQNYLRHKLKRRLLKQIPSLNQDWIRLRDAEHIPEEEIETAKLFEIPQLPGT